MNYDGDHEIKGELTLLNMNEWEWFDELSFQYFSLKDIF